MAPAFAVSPSLPVSKSIAAVSTCSFVARPALISTVRTSRASISMQSEDYKIQQSEYDDGGAVEDCGDGFIGSADLDECLGVSMPDDISRFELDEINNAKNRDELVDRLKVLKRRRSAYIDERRKGMGIDNVGNYLDQF